MREKAVRTCGLVESNSDRVKCVNNHCSGPAKGVTCQYGSAGVDGPPPTPVKFGGEIARVFLNVTAGRYLLENISCFFYLGAAHFNLLMSECGVVRRLTVQIGPVYVRVIQEIDIARNSACGRDFGARARAVSMLDGSDDIPSACHLATES